MLSTRRTVFEANSYCWEHVLFTHLHDLLGNTFSKDYYVNVYRYADVCTAIWYKAVVLFVWLLLGFLFLLGSGKGCGL